MRIREVTKPSNYLKNYKMLPLYGCKKADFLNKIRTSSSHLDVVNSEVSKNREIYSTQELQINFFSYLKETLAWYGKV